MNFKVEFLPRARRELLEAWDWYDDKWNGLGDRFMQESRGLSVSNYLQNTKA
jgi:hypothetical protein